MGEVNRAMGRSGKKGFGVAGIAQTGDAAKAPHSPRQA